MSIGKRLKNLRLKKGYTLEAAGIIAGVSKQTLYKYEQGIIKNIPSEKIKKLAELYNVPPGYIMGWPFEIHDEPGYYDGYGNFTPLRGFEKQATAISPKAAEAVDLINQMSDKDIDKLISFIRHVLIEKD